MKKYIDTISFTKLTLFAFLLFSTLINAQTDLPDAPVDAPPAPIDDYVWIMALVGLIFVFMKFRAVYNKKIQG
jgi:hypothetical protein